MLISSSWSFQEYYYVLSLANTWLRNAFSGKRIFSPVVFFLNPPLCSCSWQFWLLFISSKKLIFYLIFYFLLFYWIFTLYSIIDACFQLLLKWRVLSYAVYFNHWNTKLHSTSEFKILEPFLMKLDVFWMHRVFGFDIFPITCQFLKSTSSVFIAVVLLSLISSFYLLFHYLHLIFSRVSSGDFARELFWNW